MQKARKLPIAVCATMVVGALALTGCSNGASSNDSSGTSEATAWALTGGTHEQIWKDSFDTWNKENPDSTINVEWFANDAYKEKVRTAIGSDNAPTLIFGWGGATLADYVSAGKVADITDETSSLLEKVIPSIAAGGEIDGKVYAVPNVGTQPVVLYYNKQLFEEAGIAVPTTWDELLKAIQTFKDDGVTPIALAGSSKWTEMMWLEYLFDRVGGSDVFDNIVAGEADAWSDPAVLEALSMAQDLVNAGAFGDSFGSVSADANADVALVHTGKAAMVLQGSWAYGTFLTDAPDFVSAGNLGFAAFPTVAGGTGDPSNIVGNQANFWSVSATASESEQTTAKSYLNSLFSDEYVQAMVDGGDIPPTVGAEKFIEGSDQQDFLKFGYNLVLNSDNFQLSWDQALPSDTSQTLLDNTQQLFNLSITPQEFVDSMNATL
ncbi:extracellular solute-binding protein [Changpingibacter yushuensis]|uniref:extracellular solute-binding protein n=1 Tax=Changpingibacter yushuensis TaxID=2758440 RepID=UPI00165E1A9F|nr:extracellular solute-binding protein [Changpingibacter yushuensis]